MNIWRTGINHGQFLSAISLLKTPSLVLQGMQVRKLVEPIPMSSTCGGTLCGRTATSSAASSHQTTHNSYTSTYWSLWWLFYLLLPQHCGLRMHPSLPTGTSRSRPYQYVNSLRTMIPSASGYTKSAHDLSKANDLFRITPRCFQGRSVRSQSTILRETRTHWPTLFLVQQILICPAPLAMPRYSISIPGSNHTIISWPIQSFCCSWIAHYFQTNGWAGRNSQSSWDASFLPGSLLLICRGHES